MPLGGKTGKKLGAQIDIINTLSMSMVKIFSQLLLYHIMDDRYLSLSASYLAIYAICSMAEIDRCLYFHQLHLSWPSPSSL